MVAEVAKTLADFLDDETVVAMQDRGRKIQPFLDETFREWSVDFSKRKPTPAWVVDENGEKYYQGTDFDLYSLLNGLMQRGAVINIPYYHTLRKVNLRSDERIVSSLNRHGEIIRLSSNNVSYVFCVLINDYNVIRNIDGREGVGAPRNFAITDDSGNLNDRLHSIEWSETEVEANFNSDHKLKSPDDKIYFVHFVHPSLSFAFQGSRYLKLKAEQRRVQEQAHYYRALAKLVESEASRRHVTLPIRKKGVPMHTHIGETEKRNVMVVDARLYIPDIHGKYPIYGMDGLQDGIPNGLRRFGRLKGENGELLKKLSPGELRSIYQYSLWLANKFSYTILPRLNTMARAVELAFFKYGFKGGEPIAGKEKKPGWPVPDWTPNVRLPRGRIDWNAQMYNAHTYLLYRIKQNTMHVRIG